MNTIIFDGSKIFSVSREKDGQVNINICENDIDLKVGEVKECSIADGLTANCLARLELPNVETYKNLCRVLLSFAERAELADILGHPIAWASYTIKNTRR